MSESMFDRDIAALDSYQLLPRLLYEAMQVDCQCTLLEKPCSSPIIPLVPAGHLRLEPDCLSMVDAEVLLEHPEHSHLAYSVALLKAARMGELMPQVRRLAALGVAGLALDLSILAETPPYGNEPWRPRSREDLAELSAAAGMPLWLYGVCSIADATIASEAGVTGIVVNADAGLYLGGPATAEVFPEIFDAVAGSIAVYAGGPVRSGIDIFRYLAIGAEAVVVDSDRAVLNLRSELEYAMRLTACQTLADISYEAIFTPLFSSEP